MKRILFAAAISVFWSLSLPSFALERRQISQQEALTGVPEIVVPSGHSVFLRFNNGAYIQSFVVDDRSILAAATERPLCNRGAGESDSCGYASMLRLQRLSGALALPGASFSQGSDQSTLLTILTTDEQGNDPQTYLFTVTTTNQRPSPYVLVSIEEFHESPLYSINAISLGIQSALESGIADQESIEWIRLLRFMELVKGNVPVALAIENSSVSTDLLNSLEAIGSQASSSALPL